MPVQGKNVIKNVLISTLVQVITLVMGMILPKLILITWGSEYNGLLSSVTSIMGYLTLLEAGFNTSTLQALYKSLGQNDTDTTSSIICTSRHFYRKMAWVYAAIVGGIAVLYPLAIDSTIDYWEMVLVIFLQGASGVITFAFRASYQQLLKAEGRYYIISLITLVTTVLTYGVKILAILLYNSVLMMQLLSVGVVIVQILIYAIYFGRKYKWIDEKAECNKSLLENRRYYFGQELAGLIFNSTDTVILSVFCGLKVASVYAVYNMVYRAISQLISILRGSTNYVLGQTYHKDLEKFKIVYDVYSTIQSTLGSILASISGILIVSFIRIYTNGVMDVNYVDYIAALLFSTNMILECSRGTSLASANIAGKASETTWHYALEAGINLVSSLILVQIIGMRGVLLGTGLAGIYRTVDSIVYTNRQVLGRSPSSELKTVMLNTLVFGATFFVGNQMVGTQLTNYASFFIAAFLIGLIVAAIYGVLLWAQHRKALKAGWLLLRN